MSNGNTNSIQNGTSDNQDDLNYSEILEIGLIKHGGKIGILEDGNNYVLGNKGDILRTNF